MAPAVYRAWPVGSPGVRRHGVRWSFGCGPEATRRARGAELVTKHRRGREQLVRGNVTTIRTASELLGELEVIWQGRIERIGELLATDEDGETNS